MQHELHMIVPMKNETIIASVLCRKTTCTVRVWNTKIRFVIVYPVNLGEIHLIQEIRAFCSLERDYLYDNLPVITMV